MPCIGIGVDLRIIKLVLIHYRERTCERPCNVTRDRIVLNSDSARSALTEFDSVAMRAAYALDENLLSI